MYKIKVLFGVMLNVKEFGGITDAYMSVSLETVDAGALPFLQAPTNT